MTQHTLALYSNHQLYLLIARSNLQQGYKHEEDLSLHAQQESNLQEFFVRSTGRDNAEDAAIGNSERIRLLEVKCQALTQACVFAAMAAEAFINFYPRWKSQPARLLDSVDKLSLEAKWLVIPALLNGGQRLDPGERPMQDLQFLVSTRNQLVHSRPRSAVTAVDGELKTPDDVISNYYGISLSDADKCVKTVGQLVLGLHEIDPSVNTDWLTEDRYNPLFSVPPVRN